MLNSWNKLHSQGGVAHDLHDTSKFSTWKSWLLIHLYRYIIHIWCHHVTRILEGPSGDFPNLSNCSDCQLDSLTFHCYPNDSTHTYSRTDAQSRSAWRTWHVNIGQQQSQPFPFISLTQTSTSILFPDCFASIWAVPVLIVLLWLRQLAGCQEKHFRFSPQIFFLLAAAMQANPVAKTRERGHWNSSTQSSTRIIYIRFLNPTRFHVNPMNHMNLISGYDVPMQLWGNPRCRVCMAQQSCFQSNSHSC